MTAGITGHMELADAYDWLEKEIKNWLRSNEIELGLTALARGADTLFADICYRTHIPYKAIIPCENYISILTPEYQHSFEVMRKRARSEIILPFPNPSEEAFWAAGKKVVEECSVLLAAWNGLPGRGYGGTADAVGYAQQINKPVIHFDVRLRQVRQLN